VQYIRLLLTWGGANIYQFQTSPSFCSHPLPCCEAAPSYTTIWGVSSAGAEPGPTTHYVPVKLLMEVGSLIQAASSIEARDRGGFY